MDGYSFTLGRKNNWKGKAVHKKIRIRWEDLKAICKYELISVKGNKSGLMFAKEQAGTLSVGKN